MWLIVILLFSVFARPTPRALAARYSFRKSSRIFATLAAIRLVSSRD
jgi:hypothetical protein